MRPRINQRRRFDDNRTDDWLITYADMITLILCFFAIILSVSIVKKENLEQARQVVAEQFSSPAALIEKRASESQQRKSIAAIVSKGKGGVAVETGDRYTAIELNSAPFFASGSADLSSEGLQLLKELTPQLKGTNFQDYSITVEGHTDDVPIETTLFPSNWELSTARAAAVVRALLANGIPAGKLRAAGYADTMPKAPNRDDAGRSIPENQARNRRVVIKLEKIETS
jgi:chemotaxis protein MotB